MLKKYELCPKISFSLFQQSIRKKRRTKRLKHRNKNLIVVHITHCVKLWKQKVAQNNYCFVPKKNRSTITGTFD
jgi:hypothetical protein